MVTVRLRSDWSLPLEAPRPARPTRGRFVGRERERALLANELTSRSQGAVFVSGHRGAGKTSLVYRALGDLEAEQPKRRWRIRRQRPRFLLVVLNAAQLEAEDEDGQISARDVLTNLIRRLYTAAQSAHLSGDLHDAVTTLYRKAAAAEYRNENLSAKTSSRGLRSVTKYELKVQAIFRGSLWAVSAVIAVAVATETSLDAAPRALLVFVIGAPLPLAFRAGFSMLSSSFAEDRTTRDARLLYAFDNSLTNLEFDLEDIHRRLADEGCTAVYVIDELDKIPINQVIDVLKFFKNLFTLSAAIFVFVGGEELATHFEASIAEDGVRPQEHTFFTLRLYVPRPSDDDIKAYLSEIIEVPDGMEKEDVENLDDLCSAVAFEATGDFFDLQARLRDRISNFKDGRGEIEIRPLDQLDAARSVLQRSIHVVYESKYQVNALSRWRENERVLRSMYAFGATITSHEADSTVDVPAGADLEASAVRDLAALLTRVGLINLEQEISDEDPDLVELRYFYTPKVTYKKPEGISIISEVEEHFLSRFHTLTSRIRLILDAGRLINDGSRGPTHTTLNATSAEIKELAGLGLDIATVMPAALAMARGLTEPEPPSLFPRGYRDWRQGD
jgi:hypothetical protein